MLGLLMTPLACNAASPILMRTSGTPVENVLNTNPVAIWHFDDAGAGTAIDSYDGHDGSVSNLVATNGVKGTADTAYYFGTPGPNSRVVIADSEDWNFGNTNFTITVWAKRILSTNDDRIMDLGNTNSLDFTYALWITAASKMAFLYSQNGSVWDNILDYAGTTSVDPDAWTFLSVIRDGTNLSTYINAAVEKSWELSLDTYLHNSTSETWVGQSHYQDGVFRFRGSLDEIFIYRRAFSATELTDKYNAEKP